MAIGIGHDHPADLALADVDARCPEGDETVGLRLLITAGGRSEVEMQPVLPSLRHKRRTAPGDLRTAVRRANRGLLVLIPYQRPAQRFAPEVPGLLRTVARKRSDESAVGEEVVIRLDDAELVAFGVREHNMTVLGALTNVDVPGAELERPRHRLLLVLEGRARQIEVHLVLAGPSAPELEEIGSGTRCHRPAGARCRLGGRRPSPSPGGLPRSARDGASRAHRRRARGIDKSQFEPRHGAW
jgi:hypothetical protein